MLGALPRTIPRIHAIVRLGNVPLFEALRCACDLVSVPPAVAQVTDYARADCNQGER